MPALYHILILIVTYYFFIINPCEGIDKYCHMISSHSSLTDKFQWNTYKTICPCNKTPMSYCTSPSALQAETQCTKLQKKAGGFCLHFCT